MGNTVSNSKKTGNNESIKDISNNTFDLSEVDSLNWNNLNTDEISVSDNNVISSHNINTGALEYLNNLDIPTISESEDVFTSVGGGNTINQIIDVNFGDKLTDSVSTTSPFISSEMYKFVMKGGAEADDSESSATSSSNGDKKEEEEEENDDDENSESDKEESTAEEQSGGSSVTSASYISSSDHCGNDDNNTSSAVSTDDRVVSSSLNTSDINLISLKH